MAVHEHGALSPSSMSVASRSDKMDAWQIFLTVKAFCPIGDMLDEADAEGKSAFTVFFSGTFGVIFAGLAGT